MLSAFSRYFRRLWPVAAGLVFLVARLAADTVLLDETFTSPDRSTQNLPAAAAWYAATAAEHVAHDPVAGTFTLQAAASGARHILAYFTAAGAAPVALQPGETLRLEYDISFVNPDPNTVSPTSNPFRLGLFNANLAATGAPRVDADDLGGVNTTNTGTYYDSYVGYRFDTILHSNTSNPQMRVYRRASGFSNSALLVISTAYSGALAATDVPQATFPGGLYHGVVEIHRGGNGAVSFTHRLRSADEAWAIDILIGGVDNSAAAVSSFDTVAFALNTRVAEAFVLHRVGITVLAAAEPDPSVDIQVGNRVIRTAKFTKKGTPVVPMWDAPMPTLQRRSGAGFPVLTQAEHAYVWRPPTRADGAYNHYATLALYQGRFFTMWANHPTGEDGPGQRILYAWSDAWGQWSDAMELFPAPGPVLDRSQSGIHLKAERLVVVEDTLYAIVFVHGAGIYPIARSISRDGTLGDPFLVRSLPGGAEYPVYMQGYTNNTERVILGAKIRRWYTDNNHVSWWGRYFEGVPNSGIDGAGLIESYTYRARDGGYVLFTRYWGHSGNPVHNNRMYVSFSDRLNSWSAPYPTDIPDSPSRAQALTLDDGTVLLIGNQNVPWFDEALYLDRDPMTVAISDDGYTFDRVFALRTAAPLGWRISNVAGRNLGFAYSSSLTHRGWLYTSYTIGKEDMAITRVPLAAMGLPVSDDSALYAMDDWQDAGWHTSPWLGAFWDGAYPQVYTPDLGWLYVFGTPDGLLHAHHPDIGWFCTGAGIYPYLYAYGPEGQGWYLADGTKLSD
jgi:hypothetical protein